MEIIMEIARALGVHHREVMNALRRAGIDKGKVEIPLEEAQYFLSDMPVHQGRIAESAVMFYTDYCLPTGVCYEIFTVDGKVILRRFRQNPSDLDLPEAPYEPKHTL